MQQRGRIMENNYFNDPFLSLKKEQQIREIRHYGTVSGICVLCFFAIQEAFSLLLMASGFYGLYQTDTLFRQGFELIVTVTAICLPFFLAGKHFSKKTHYDVVPAGKANKISIALPAIPAGAGLCLIVSYLTAYLSMIPEMFGFQFTMPDMTPPATGYELFIYLLRLTLIAGVIEETAFRGVVLQPLRKYGNWFAILMSASIFALIHCNLIQAPFALLAGMVIGYFTVLTESIWVGIGIHAINNGISALIGQINATMGAEAANLIGTYIIIGTIIIGLVCCVLIFVLRGKAAFDRETEIHPDEIHILNKREKAKAFFGNIPMILAVAAVCWYTHYYISI